MNLHNKRMFVAAFTMAGSVIGAGVLGLPYVFSKSGFWIGIFWIVFLGLILVYAKLCFGEVTLRTKSRHQLQGYAGKYLGKLGANFAFFSMFFGIYAALLAYLIGEGQSLSMLFTGSLNYSLIFGFLFWLVMTLLLKDGLRGLKKVEMYGVFAIIAIVIVLFFIFVPEINLNNTYYFDYGNFFVPFGVTLFALLGFSAIPEMRAEIKKSEKFLRKAIILGSTISIAVYVLFSFTFVGVFGQNVQEIATLSSGKIVIIFGVFTMLTSYFVLSFAMRDMFLFDLHKRKGKRFFYVSIVPILLYFVVGSFNLAGFVMILGIAGVISGGVTGVLILTTNMVAKEKGNRKPEYSMPLNWIVVGTISLVFVVGVIVQILFYFSNI